MKVKNKTSHFILNSKNLAWFIILKQLQQKEIDSRGIWFFF